MGDPTSADWVWVWSPEKNFHILNRALCWCRDGLGFAADVKHAKEVIDELGVTQSLRLTSPVGGPHFWASLGQSAPLRRGGDASVPPDRGEAQLSRARVSGASAPDL